MTEIGAIFKIKKKKTSEYLLNTILTIFKILYYYITYHIIFNFFMIFVFKN